MNYLIILINRIGDCAQSFPMVKGLLDSGNHVDMVINENYKPLLEFLPKINAITDIENIEEKEYDVVLNYSSNQKAVEIFNKTKAKRKIGFPASIGDIQSIHGKWMNYFLSVPWGRLSNSFSISDMFSRVAGVDWIVPGPYIQCDKDTELINITDKPKIGLVLGASERNRMWWNSSWNALIDRINEKIDCDIYLLGSGESEEIEAESITKRDNVYNLIGQTTLRELIIVVNNLDLVVSGDTGTLHLAAMSGIPVVGLYLGPSYLWATGPYGESNYAIQPRLACSPCQYNQYCSNENCKDRIDPEEVFLCVMRLLDIESECNPFFANDVYYTKFNKDLKVLEYIPEEGYIVPLTIEKILAFIAREVWISTIIGEDYKTYWQHGYKIEEDTRIFLEEAVQTFPLMAQCCSEGLEIIKQHNGDKNDFKAFLSTHNSLAGINRRIWHLSKKSKTTCLALRFFEIGIDMVNGANGEEFLEHYRYHYEFMRDFLTKMYHEVFHFEVKC